MGMFVCINNILVMITKYKNSKTFSFPASIIRTKLTKKWTNADKMVSEAYFKPERWGKEKINKYVIKFETNK